MIPVALLDGLRRLFEKPPESTKQWHASEILRSQVRMSFRFKRRALLLAGRRP